MATVKAQRLTKEQRAAQAGKDAADALASIKVLEQQRAALREQRDGINSALRTADLQSMAAQRDALNLQITQVSQQIEQAAAKLRKASDDLGSALME